jgi:hypothetical protein
MNTSYNGLPATAGFRQLTIDVLELNEAGV